MLASVAQAATLDMIADSRQAANIKNRMMTLLFPPEILAAKAATRWGMLVRLSATVMASVPMQNAMRETLTLLNAAPIPVKPPITPMKQVQRMEAIPEGRMLVRDRIRKTIKTIKHLAPSADIPNIGGQNMDRMRSASDMMPKISLFFFIDLTPSFFLFFADKHIAESE